MKYLPVLLAAFIIILSCNNNDSEIVNNNNNNNNPNENDNSNSDITIDVVDFFTTIDENPTANQLIGTVEASTNQGKLNYELTKTSVSGAFSIDSSSGDVFVANKNIFDYEKHQVIRGTVKVSNGSIFKFANINININNINDPHVFTGNVYLTNQNEVNSFGNNHYTHIDGELKINDHLWDIKSLSPLSNLTEIGSLNIRYCNKLTSLEGLNNLKKIHNNLIIQGCRELLNIEALYNLENIDLNNNLEIAGNVKLSSLNSLLAIKKVNGSLAIIGNNNLDNLVGLNNLSAVENILEISSNQQLVHIEDLNKLTYIGGDLRIDFNLQLNNLKGLNQLSEIRGDFYLIASILSNNLEGLNNLNLIGKDLKISNNHNLKDFCTISSLMVNNGIGGSFIATDNLYNPNQQQIKDGNCSL